MDRLGRRPGRGLPTSPQEPDGSIEYERQITDRGSVYVARHDGGPVIAVDSDIVDGSGDAPEQYAVAWPFVAVGSLRYELFAYQYDRDRYLARRVDGTA